MPGRPRGSGRLPAAWVVWGVWGLSSSVRVAKAGGMKLLIAELEWAPKSHPFHRRAAELREGKPCVLKTVQGAQGQDGRRGYAGAGRGQSRPAGWVGALCGLQACTRRGSTRTAGCQGVRRGGVCAPVHGLGGGAGGRWVRQGRKIGGLCVRESQQECQTCREQRQPRAKAKAGGGKEQFPGGWGYEMLEEDKPQPGVPNTCPP